MDVAGVSFHPGIVNDLDDLPTHVYAWDGELVMKPCAEVLLTDRGAATILDRGLIPLRSVRNRGAVRVESFVSIAGSRATLRGRWG